MVVIIINDAPYGNERPYNALRLALSLTKKEEEVKVFLLADAVLCAMNDQKTPNGYYNVGRMVRGLIGRGTDVFT